jgi:hypothetical protein
MLWTFSRDGCNMHYEIRRAEDGQGFEIVKYYADGRQECEWFAGSESLNQRAVKLQQALLDEGWCISADPRR